MPMPMPRPRPIWIKTVINNSVSASGSEKEYNLELRKSGKEKIFLTTNHTKNLEQRSRNQKNLLIDDLKSQ